MRYRANVAPGAGPAPSSPARRRVSLPAVTVSRFSFPTDIRFGPGARAELAGVCSALGIGRPLVVVDRGITGLPFVAELRSALGQAGATVGFFDGIAGNPVESQVEAGAAAYRSHEADGIVAVGGGAALDVAKAIAVLASHPGSLFDYEDGAPGAREVTAAAPPIVALPTTAGTGSEVGRSAVISDEATHVKRIIFSPHLLARCVLADPELTVGLPPAVTAATGFDALTHNIEAYLARDYHPICDGIALEGLRIGAANLRDAVANPADIGARSGMLMSSMMGAIAFQKGLGLVHSTAHALGTAYDLHHGLANAVMIDHALRWNVEAVPERMADLAEAARLDQRDAAGLLGWLASLRREVGLPPGPAAAVGPTPDIGRLSTLAAQDGCHLNNPRPVTEADFVTIFTAAFAAGA